MQRQEDKRPDDAEKLDLEKMLFEAAKYGKVDEVSCLLDAGVNINATCQETISNFNIENNRIEKTLVTDVTALHLAVLNGRFQMADLLVKRGADVFIKANLLDDQQPMDALDCAVVANRPELVKWLLDSCHMDVNGKDKYKAENYYPLPLIVAAALGYTEIVNLLIKHGAELVNIKDGDGPLTLVCEASPWNIEVVKLLVKKKVKISQNDFNPIYSAITTYNFFVKKNQHEWYKGIKCKETIEFLLRCGFGLFVKMYNIKNAFSFPLPPQTVVIGMQINDNGATHSMLDCGEEVIITVEELQQAISEGKKLNVELVVFLHSCELLIKLNGHFQNRAIAAEASTTEEDTIIENKEKLQEELITLIKTKNLIKSTLSLKELSMTAVCKNGFFSQHSDDKEKRDAYRASIPIELRKEMKQYRRYRV